MKFNLTVVLVKMTVYEYQLDFILFPQVEQLLFFDQSLKQPTHCPNNC